jgi:hypothetical protein
MPFRTQQTPRQFPSSIGDQFAKRRSVIVALVERACNAPMVPTLRRLPRHQSTTKNNASVAGWRRGISLVNGPLIRSVEAVPARRSGIARNAAPSPSSRAVSSLWSGGAARPAIPSNRKRFTDMAHKVEVERSSEECERVSKKVANGKAEEGGALSSIVRRSRFNISNKSLQVSSVMIASESDLPYIFRQFRISNRACNLLETPRVVAQHRYWVSFSVHQIASPGLNVTATIHQIGIGESLAARPLCAPWHLA